MSANTSEQALTSLIKWLRNRHAEVMAAEAQALARLDAGDTPGHNEMCIRDSNRLVSTQISILRKCMCLYLYCLCPPAPVAVFATREQGSDVVSGHAP